MIDLYKRFLLTGYEHFFFSEAAREFGILASAHESLICFAGAFHRDRVGGCHCNVVAPATAPPQIR